MSRQSPAIFHPLLGFMKERHQIYLRRKNGMKGPPWTEDAILQTYSFTNVYRELDRVTVWVRKHIREPFAGHRHLWFMTCIARQINWPDTLEELMADKKGAWPHSQGTSAWNWERCRDVLRARAATGAKVYTGAYMLRGPIQGDPSGSQDKPNYTTLRVLQPVWEDRHRIAPLIQGTSLQTAHSALMGHHGWGGFMSYEVVCDLRYTDYLSKAPDKLTWSWAGPGALRGLQRIWGEYHHKGTSENERKSWNTRQRRPSEQEQALERMAEILSYLRTQWPRGWPALEMREVEHSLCEFDKYERARLGQGRPRSKFTPTKEI